MGGKEKMKKSIGLTMLFLLITLSLFCTNTINAKAATSEASWDFNDDYIIDSMDVASLADSCNLTSIDNNWNSKYDLNGDNIINIYDVFKILKVVGTTTLPDNTDITSKFTDVKFKTSVYASIGKTSPEPILYSDVKGIKQLNVSNKAIRNLSGIEYFTSLTMLDCRLNKLKALDVSKNTGLTELYCSQNQLTNLDVSHNTALTGLYCDYNKLATLDVSKNMKLTTLYCKGNQLAALAVNENTALTKLYCSGNQLATLDVSNNRALTKLYCDFNQLVTLDVSENTALTDLNCYYNQLTNLYSMRTWLDENYKIQYTDSSNENIAEDLSVTIKVQM